jgi:dTDP-4-dehydrorhamnose reductase
VDIFKPWAIVNAAGYVRVDDAERDRGACYRANTFAVGVLARECAHQRIPLVTFSSDLVFDGAKGDYVESDHPSPLGAYGASKAAAEVSALGINPQSLIIRTSAFFGPWDEWNFPLIALRTLLEGLPFAAANDTIVSPTYVPDLVNASLDLLIDGEHGIWHLANEGAMSWSDLACEVAARAGLSAELVRPVTSRALGYAARRPASSVLRSRRGNLLPTIDSALDRWLDAIRSRELIDSAALQ